MFHGTHACKSSHNLLAGLLVASGFGAGLLAGVLLARRGRDERLVEIGYDYGFRDAQTSLVNGGGPPVGEPSPD